MWASKRAGGGGAFCGWREREPCEKVHASGKVVGVAASDRVRVARWSMRACRSQVSDGQCRIRKPSFRREGVGGRSCRLAESKDGWGGCDKHNYLVI